LNGQISILSLILHASILVQLVMLLLLMLSVVSWTFIFQRNKALKEVASLSDEFEDLFWSGGDLVKLYEQACSRRGDSRGMEAIFKAGFKEFMRLRNQADSDPTSVMVGTERAMRVALSHEQSKLETHLAFLATVGSTSPYVGLFGTVWGIMSAFQALGTVQQATLAMVAPGISEALVATAMGLFAAIPAVVAYNRYADSAGNLGNRFQTFADEFSTILHRRVYGPQKQQA